MWIQSVQMTIQTKYIYHLDDIIPWRANDVMTQWRVSKHFIIEKNF